MWPEVAQKDDDTSGASSSIGGVNLLHMPHKLGAFPFTFNLNLSQNLSFQFIKDKMEINHNSNL